MSVTITLEALLIPTKEQEEKLVEMSNLYINLVNDLVDNMTVTELYTTKTSKDIDISLPSVVKNEAIRSAKSVFTKILKSNYKILPLLKKTVCIWNNLGYSLKKDCISIAMVTGEKVGRVDVKTVISKRDNSKLDYYTSGKLGTLRISRKNNKWIAQIAYTVEPKYKESSEKVMGVDLGIKVPAVAITDCGKVNFFGSGRKNKYKRRQYQTLRKSLGTRKKSKKIKLIGNKEQRYMKDQDHKVSRSIVNFAKKHDIGVIRLEHLTGIRKTTRKSRKNNRSLHNWSFYRLAQYIEYKAKLAGIKVEYVDPAYTSQKCPKCSKLNKCVDRQYTCECGINTHRDLIGAMNIRYAPMYDGKSRTA